ncbi:hypothetical protein ACLK1T_28415 [Escherichia coli]
MFYALGSDGSVSVTKNNIKIIGILRRGTHRAILFTTPKGGRPYGSHLRVSEQPIRSAYLISQADFRRLPPVAVYR